MRRRGGVRRRRLQPRGGLRPRRRLHDSLFVGAPLNVERASGSPINPPVLKETDHPGRDNRADAGEDGTADEGDDEDGDGGNENGDR